MKLKAIFLTAFAQRLRAARGNQGPIWQKTYTMKEIAFALLYVSLLPVVTYGSAQEVANQLFPKTVLLNTKDTSGRPLALGSGFVLKKGYIVTNYHVVEGAGSGLVRRLRHGMNIKWCIHNYLPC